MAVTTRAPTRIVTPLQSYCRGSLMASMMTEASKQVRRQQNVTAPPKDKKGDHQKKQTSFAKPNKHLGDNSMSGRPIKPTFQRKLNHDDMKLQQKSDRRKIQTRPLPTQPNKLKCPDEDAEQVKLEGTKRKFQERYQAVERAIDHGNEFKLRRDRIPELLFSCKITRGNGCDKVEFVVPNVDNIVSTADKVVSNVVDVNVDKDKQKFKDEAVKERKVMLI
ncbi:putative protein RADIALIS-like 1-like [Capsicum annuum]|uniref:Uncharacterized protein n=1 Tax=Capsicum annuum TaxID=4072 RepID=A0A2G2YMG1_CAPAN|nr:putative protein RADIALIS-like 1-like [Capsicum annuum]KAF3646255.1 putative protein RADIALIS-like 1-like [Capsicum annuum]PHT70781.1 hypothetical protein T459_25885 [Capsicum annuum]